MACPCFSGCLFHAPAPTWAACQDIQKEIPHTCPHAFSCIAKITPSLNAKGMRNAFPQLFRRLFRKRVRGLRDKTVVLLSANGYFLIDRNYVTYACFHEVPVQVDSHEQFDSWLVSKSLSYSSKKMMSARLQLREGVFDVGNSTHIPVRIVVHGRRVLAYSCLLRPGRANPFWFGLASLFLAGWQLAVLPSQLVSFQV